MTFDLKSHLIRIMAFSWATWGPGTRQKGVIDHLRKELDELEESNGSTDEWIDIIILGVDGFTRAAKFDEGRTAIIKEEIAQELIDKWKAKQERNEGREWPDWRTMSQDKAIEHKRHKLSQGQIDILESIAKMTEVMDNAGFVDPNDWSAIIEEAMATGLVSKAYVIVSMQPGLRGVYTAELTVKGREVLNGET